MEITVQFGRFMAGVGHVEYVLLMLGIEHQCVLVGLLHGQE